MLIAIEGFGGSGKTTFAEQLKNALGNSYVVNIDDFIVEEKLTEHSWDAGAFDLKRLEKHVLVPASHNQQVMYQSLSWDTNTLSLPKKVPPVDYLVVEGVSSYHPEQAADYIFDHKQNLDSALA